MITFDPDLIGTIDTADIPQKRVDIEKTPFARLPRMERLKVLGKADVSADVDAGEDSDIDGEGDGDNDAETDGKRQKMTKEKERNKMRGKNKSLKRHLRKRKKNIIDPATVSTNFPVISSMNDICEQIAIREKIANQRALIAESRRKERGEVVEEDKPKGALDRFRR